MHTQAEFCVAKGFKADAEVIYGDTDSVMVNFKVRTRLCNAMADLDCHQVATANAAQGRHRRNDACVLLILDSASAAAAHSAAAGHAPPHPATHALPPRPLPAPLSLPLTAPCPHCAAPATPQTPDVAEAMALGQQAAQLISTKFPPPVKLEFEKVRVFGRSALPLLLR